MDYRFYPKINNIHHNIFRYFNISIEYYSINEIYEMYPEGNFEVIGEIGYFFKRYDGQDVIIADTGTEIPIFPRGSLRKPFEWVAGYAQVGENIYVSVVRNVIPRWIFDLFVRRL